jgi:beta-fructofuranosidase
MPRANWMNDPNGPIYWKGTYHMFYQYNPNGAFWGDMHWGHAEGMDMVHWRHMPIALSPTPHGPDKDGCFSGCAVDNQGVPSIIYTGVSPEVQCLATSNDALVEWKKYDGNPIIGRPPNGPEVTGFRDPCVWKEGDAWYLALGSGYRGQGGVVFLYRSLDLIHWDYMHELCRARKDETSSNNDPVASGEMWECPDFFPLGERHVLLISTKGSVFYSAGPYEHDRLVREKQGNVDWGGEYYAARTMLDARGRRVLWGWIREGRSEVAHRAAGWAGVMSLPRVLSLNPDNTLGMVPHPNVETLRGEKVTFENEEIKPNNRALLKGVHGTALEIAAEIDPGSATQCGLRLFCSGDFRENTLVAYDRHANVLRVDREHSSLNPEAHHTAQECPLDLAGGSPFKVRIFVDASVLEIFLDGRACLTSRVYPTLKDSQGLSLFAAKGKARLRRMEVWQLKPISPDRMTT